MKTRKIKFTHYLSAWQFGLTLAADNFTITRVDLHTWILELPCNSIRGN